MRSSETSLAARVFLVTSVSNIDDIEVVAVDASEATAKLVLLRKIPGGMLAELRIDKWPPQNDSIRFEVRWPSNSSSAKPVTQVVARRASPRSRLEK